MMGGGSFRISSKLNLENQSIRRKLASKVRNSPKGFSLFDLLDKTSGLHLVDDLLLGLCLSDEIGVCTG